MTLTAKIVKTDKFTLMVEIFAGDVRLGSVRCDSTESGYQPDADHYGKIAKKMDETGKYDDWSFSELCDEVAETVYEALEHVG